MINGIKPKVICCSKCSSSIPTERLSMGYTICTNCSTEEKKVGHIIYPHKTGAYIQVMDKDTHKELNKLDRRGYKGKGGYKHYKELTVSQSSSDTKVYTDKSSTHITHTPYNNALKEVLGYYDEWGYERTLGYLRKLNSDGKIPLMTRVKLQDIVSEKYMNPSPRALKRKFNGGCSSVG